MVVRHPPASSKAMDQHLRPPRVVHFQAHAAHALYVLRWSCIIVCTPGACGFAAGTPASRDLCGILYSTLHSTPEAHELCVVYPWCVENFAPGAAASCAPYSTLNSTLEAHELCGGVPELQYPAPLERLSLHPVQQDAALEDDEMWLKVSSDFNHFKVLSPWAWVRRGSKGEQSLQSL
eukprot:1158501-Pelagomonas_calceolata.AAC.4